jgi:hypothetical protein
MSSTQFACSALVGMLAADDYNNVAATSGMSSLITAIGCATLLHVFAY